jgi:hypothetical protein
MRLAPSATLTSLCLALLLAGCSDRGLRDLRNPGEGPDEFLVMPAKPLTPPPDYAVLPAPTPGGSNLTDQNPNADAVAALGGNPAALGATAVPGSDGALVNATRRYGVEGNVREVLAQDDADFRRRQARLSGVRLFPIDRYAQSYRRQAIDPFDEAERFRRSGIATSSSPPF